MNLNEYIKEVDKNNPEIKIDLDKDLSYQIGNEVFEARLRKGWTQEKLAQEAKTNSQVLLDLKLVQHHPV